MFLYLLHFERKICHAQHYLGVTDDVQLRLRLHAIGHGARLTEVCLQNNIDWVLAGLWQTNPAFSGRILERQTKNRNNGRRHCPICMSAPETPAQSRPIALHQLQFPIDSFTLRTRPWQLQR